MGEVFPDSEILVRLRSGRRRIGIFFVHPLHGNVLCYGALALFYGHDRPFFGLQSRGLAAGRASALTVNAMAQDYLAAVLHLQPEGPYVFGGWSLGASVALEMARSVERAGRGKALVLSIDSPLTDRGLPCEPSEYLARMVLQHGFSDGFLGAYQVLGTQEAKMAALLDEAYRAKRFPPALNRQAAARLLGVQWANCQACALYHPDVRDVPVEYFLAANTLPFGHGQQWRDHFFRGWDAGAARVIPNTHHLSILSQPFVKELAVQMSECVEQQLAQFEA